MSDKIMYNTIQTILADLKRKLSIDRDETVKGQYTFEKFPDLPSSEQNTFLEESIKKGALDSFGQRIVDEGLSDGLRERFIGQGLGQDQVANRSLDRLICLRYRNLEGDLFLPVADYEGRTRPIETKILVKEKSHPYYVIENCPYIMDMVQNPTDWLLYDISSGNPDNAVKILSAEYIGEYEGSTNCCALTLNINRSQVSQGAHVGICSFKARGIEYNYLPAFVPGAGRGQVVSCGASWYDRINEKYRALVSFLVLANPLGRRMVTKAFSTTNRMGSWVQDDSNAAIGDFDDLIPEGYHGFSQLFGFIKISGRDGLYAANIGIADDTTTIQNPNYTVKLWGLLIFSEDLTYKKLIIPELDYVYENGISIHNYGGSIAFYKGKYHVTVHDGTTVPVWAGATGKRIVLTSDQIEGPYDIDSVIYDYAEPWMTQPGNPFSLSSANGALFVFNSELYYLTSASSLEMSSGSYQNHEIFLLKYNDANKKWSFCAKGPVFHYLAGNSANYPDLNINWGWDHMGATTFHYIENNKLWFGVSIKASDYSSSVGYIDLDKALS